jgi:tetraacyldisaccharide 4'-kinase
VSSKVISVGNLVVGGAGKTPTVIFITKKLKELGKSAAILSRGYKRSTKGYKLVSDGKEMLASVNESGDEIYFAAEECQVPSAVSEKRVDGALRLINKFDVETIILDDAFQHRWIARDLNILVFDQKFLKVAGRMDQRLLPLGSMREPFSSIERSDAIFINRKFSNKEEIPPKVAKFFNNKPVFHAYYKATGFYDVKDHKFYEIDEFKGQRSLVVCGIARPHSFLNVLKNNEIDLTNRMTFRDHKSYTLKEIQSIRKEFYETNSYSVITTQKDAVKLNAFSREFDDIDIYYLKIEMVVEEEEKLIEMLKNIFNEN